MKTKWKGISSGPPENAAEETRTLANGPVSSAPNQDDRWAVGAQASPGLIGGPQDAGQDKHRIEKEEECEREGSRELPEQCCELAHGGL
jgi:hypothetical protein